MKRNADAAVERSAVPEPNQGTMHFTANAAECRASNAFPHRTAPPRSMQNVKYMSGQSRLQRASLSVQERVVVVQLPNPSIEGMPKRLRLLSTPHVKR